MDPRTRQSIRILEQHGYRYLYDRDVFVNRRTRKCFSLEFVEDHPDRIAALALEQNPGRGWQFYFNRSPSITLRSELERLLTEVA